MIGFLIAATTLGLQTPMPPDVVLPKGWNVKYWSSAGFGTGELIGPDKEEIIFHGYTPTGAVAATTHQTDPWSLYVRTILDRRHIDVAVRSDNYLAVSYRPLVRSDGLEVGSFDYWIKAKTARQVAKALAITLTRLDVLHDRKRPEGTPGANAQQFESPSQEFPFENLSVWYPFQHGHPPKKPGFRFENIEGLSVSLQGETAPKLKWEDNTSLLGRELHWGEDGKGHTWAWIAGSAEKPASFMSSAVSGKGITLAMLMALTYKPPTP